MRDLRKNWKRGFSWILTAALAVGLMPAAGITAGADTMTSAGRESNRTATASEAEKVEEEPLDEDGFLQDGEIWNDTGSSAYVGTPSNATPSDAKRRKYPEVYAGIPILRFGI